MMDFTGIGKFNFDIFNTDKIKNSVKNKDITTYFSQDNNSFLANNEMENGFVDLDFDGEDDANVVYIKDENGTVIGAELFSMDNNEAISKVNFSYENNKVTQIAIDEDLDGKSDYTHSYEFNKDYTKLKSETIEDETKKEKKVIETNYNNFLWFETKNETIREYDKDGQILTEDTKNYNSDGEVTRKNSKEYNENGEIVAEDTRKYNSNGELVEKTQTEQDEDGVTRTSKTTVTYEDNGDSYRVEKNYADGKFVGGEERYHDSKSGKTTSYALDTNAKDGKVDFTEQGGVGDCWLLAAMNALNYQDPQILKDMISYTDNGAKIEFAFATYEVSDEELQAEKAERQYANGGDDDIIRFEIAMEKMLEDYTNGDLKLPISALSSDERVLYEHGDEEKDEILIDGGFSAQALYFMTGKKVDVVKNSGFTNFFGNLLLDGLGTKIDSGSAVATTAFKESFTCKDINGNEIELIDHHAYTIKSIDDETVILVNPWYGDEEIKIDIETFSENYRDIAICNLDAKKENNDSAFPWFV